MTGRSPSSGVASLFAVTRLFSSPPTAKLCPSASSTSVVSVRLVRLGITNPLNETLREKSRSLTSGVTLRRMRPSPRTAGEEAALGAAVDHQVWLGQHAQQVVAPQGLDEVFERRLVGPAAPEERDA